MGLLFALALAAVVPVAATAASGAQPAPALNDTLPEKIFKIAFPPGTPILILQTFTLLLGGVVVLLLFNQWRSRRDDRPKDASLAREVRALKRLKIGYPEGMTFLEALRSQRFLEQRLEPLGLAITWTCFPSASSLLSALSNGTIDFCGGGGTASILSQAAEHLFVRVAKEKYPDITGQAILVPEDSPIQNLRDLKGKRIAFDEGSSAHYVIIRALEKVGLSYGDIEPVQLPQSEDLPLFRRKEVDAWVIWMPYAATSIRRAYPGRSIADLDGILGDPAGVEVPTLYYAIPELVRDYPRVLKALLEEVNEAGSWVNKNQLAASKRLLDSFEIDPEIVEVLEKRSLERAIIPIDEQTLNALQNQANTLRDLRLIPERVNVHDGTYSLQTRQNWSY
jgi:sulfonate transport system substrate-binding protein